ncbi:MAG: MFS transporter, partial [Nitrospirae bacterium]|nr:MFS transporter [Nitrospirota bacterium]
MQLLLRCPHTPRLHRQSRMLASALPVEGDGRSPVIAKGRFIEGLREVVSNLSILGASITQALQFFATGAIEGFLPIYAKQVAGLKPWQIGFLFGVQTVSTLMARPIMGAMSDRIGRRPQIIAGLLCGASIVWMIPHIRIFYG